MGSISLKQHEMEILVFSTRLEKYYLWKWNGFLNISIQLKGWANVFKIIDLVRSGQVLDKPRGGRGSGWRYGGVGEFTWSFVILRDTLRDPTWSYMNLRFFFKCSGSVRILKKPSGISHLRTTALQDPTFPFSSHRVSWMEPSVDFMSPL